MLTLQTLSSSLLSTACVLTSSSPTALNDNDVLLPLKFMSLAQTSSWNHNLETQLSTQLSKRHLEYCKSNVELSTSQFCLSQSLPSGKRHHHPLSW